jgi:hypothetical protein
MEMSQQLPVDTQIVAVCNLINSHGMSLDDILKKHPFLSAGITQMRSNMAQSA